LEYYSCQKAVFFCPLRAVGSLSLLFLVAQNQGVWFFMGGEATKSGKNANLHRRTNALLKCVCGSHDERVRCVGEGEGAEFALRTRP